MPTHGRQRHRVLCPPNLIEPLQQLIQLQFRRLPHVEHRLDDLRRQQPQPQLSLSRRTRLMCVTAAICGNL